MQDMSPPLMGDEANEGGSIPFTGPLEDLFTCAASPEIEELSFPSPAAELSTLSSPSISLFEIESADTSSLLTDYTESPHNSELDRALWEWHALEQYPCVMELVAAAQASDKANQLGAEELQVWSDIALAA